ncbi:GNAT family N-acetyltransferase [Reyranella sp.]|uniref:GNAT family N-acetyltransferase n=1 Tax=Reyranella sp. TaxID=1929291 RepID=UPI003D0F620B
MSVTHNAAQQRYELLVDHGLAIAAYREQGKSRVFTHTEVPPEDVGKGIGARIVKAALEDTRQQGFKIVPACSFVVAYVRRHPEFDDSAT